MQPLKVIIVRHAEKPADNENQHPPLGVNEEGWHDPRSLSPLGWQRAGALAPWFARAASPLATPAALFASHHHGTSHRPRQTLVSLAGFLKLPIHAEIPVGEEKKLAEAVLACGDGPVLIAWEHNALPRIPSLLAGPTLCCPAEWPADRFDLAWVLDRDAGGAWRFAQVPQLLLGGDSPALLPLG
jgi:hypothetical protein